MIKPTTPIVLTGGSNDVTGQLLPLQTLEFTNKNAKAIPVHGKPGTQRPVIGSIASGKSFTVQDWFAPDWDDPQTSIRWHRLVGRRGWIQRGYVPAYFERKVVSTERKGNMRWLMFNNDTYMVVPDPIVSFKIPDTGGPWAQVSHDWQMDRWDHKSRKYPTNNSAPETVRTSGCKPGDFIELTEPFQRLWFELNIELSHRSLTLGQYYSAKLDVESAEKALTDQNAVSYGYTDYVIGINLNGTKGGIRQKCLLLGGNPVINPSGRTYRCINMTKPAPTVSELLASPGLWGLATEISGSPMYSNKTWPVSDWPNYNKWGGWGVGYLHIGMGDTNAVVDADGLHRVAAGSVISPYNSAP